MFKTPLHYQDQSNKFSKGEKKLLVLNSFKIYHIWPYLPIIVGILTILRCHNLTLFNFLQGSESFHDHKINFCPVHFSKLMLINWYFIGYGQWHSHINQIKRSKLCGLNWNWQNHKANKIRLNSKVKGVLPVLTS